MFIINLKGFKQIEKGIKYGIISFYIVYVFITYETIYLYNI